MAAFYVTLKVGNPDGGELIPINALVDTGATHSLLPMSMIPRLGITGLRPTLVGGIGGHTKYTMGNARFVIGDEERLCEVFFGTDELFLLGASALDQFNLVVDMTNKRLLYAQDQNKEYDVFVAHASEDKGDVARPLAHALKIEGLTVWYDEFEIKIGDSVTERINYGIATSRAGVVVFSRHFFAKAWTNFEVRGMVTRMLDDSYTILPVWHNLTKRDVIKFSPSLADIWAGDTSKQSINQIASEIAQAITAQVRVAYE